MEDNNEIVHLDALPKDMKFIVLTQLDAQSLGRLMQTNKSFHQLPTEVHLWKHQCMATWQLSPESKIHNKDFSQIFLRVIIAIRSHIILFAIYITYS